MFRPCHFSNKTFFLENNSYKQTHLSKGQTFPFPFSVHSQQLISTASCFQVVDCLKGKLKVSPAELKPYIQVGSESEKYVQMHLPAAALENSFNVPNAAQLLAIEPDDIIGKVHCIQEQKTKTICFEINKNLFIKDIIENCALPYINFHPKHVVVEFSSPNVAKPFHLGHLRSTIIGNFVANLYDYFHNNVTKLNYLGDWGTQFGFIKVGMEELKYTKEDLKRNPIKMLYQSYVHANKLGETDPEILKRARNEFSRLENGPPETLSDWKAIMDFTKEELERTYERLGVSFTEYHMESMYNIKDIQNVIDRLTEKDVLQAQDGGKKVAVVNDRQVPLVKSDGSSLYLTRDVAAAIDRFDKYKFDRMFYLADNSQHDHFANLKLILQKLDLPFANRIQHVKFGRVRGMSSRRGNAVFLKDILDECRELVVQKQIQSPSNLQGHPLQILDLPEMFQPRGCPSRTIWRFRTRWAFLVWSLTTLSRGD